MSDIPEATSTDRPPERKPEATLFLPNKDKAPEGLADVGLGKEVTFTVTGKVQRASVDAWDNGGINLTLEISKLSLESSGKPITLGDAIEKAKKTV